MTTTQSRQCNARCSHNVSDAQLTAWGFPVQVTDKLCGCTFTVVEGTSRGQAMHLAWVAGLVDVCSALPHSVEEMERRWEAGQAVGDRVSAVLAQAQAVAA